MFFESSSLLKPSRNTYLVIAVIYMGGIYFLSSLPLPLKDIRHPNLVGFCANMFHFPLYMGFCFTLLLSFRGDQDQKERLIHNRTVLLSMLILACYGAFDEYHQSWSGRTPSVMDFLVDLCGGFCAVWVLRYYLEQSLSKKKFISIVAGFIALACCFSYAGMF